MKQEKSRINNKGLSLVELLIAVTILSIIVAPLLHAFVSSARINRKSKQTLRLTTMGQDVMEGLKAYSLEELAYEFDYPTVSSCNVHPAGFQLISPTMLASNSKVMELSLEGGNKYKKVTTSTPIKQSIKESGAAPNIEYEFDESKYSSHEPYYFAVTNVSSEVSRTESYKADILITVDPRKYINDTDAATLGVTGRNVSANTAQHNSNPMAELFSMDTTMDAFFLESGTQVNSAFNELLSQGAFAGIPSPSAKDLSREIDVLVEDASPNKKVTYTFKYKAGGQEVIYPSNPAFRTLSYTKLENVYLFYMPSYTTAGDKITYTNLTGDKVKFSLVKRQILPEDALVPEYEMDDLFSLSNAENNYRCSVGINDTSYLTELKTNVKTDISRMIDPSFTGDVLAPTLSGVTIRYNSTPLPASGLLPVAGSKDEDRLFDVTIDIYEPGTLDACETTATRPDPDKHLVTVHGNMN